ncbi:MAG TPA: hypothetical protein VMA09_14355, partial [Candidatus Binataceae bacterium]|nr:hypothetical protein [Candidatus Binataceae bacterium]
TADPKPEMLVQFGQLGVAYAQIALGTAVPRVGLLTIGAEPGKGNALTRRAHELLAAEPVGGALPLHFEGNVEGGDLMAGAVDVIVTDGFTGNVALKTMEGMASFMLGNLRELFTANWRGRLSYLLVRKHLSEMRTKLDPHEYGGAPLLGVSGVSIIAHGSSNSHAIRNALRAAAHEALVKQVNPEILDILAKIQPSVPLKPAGGKGIRALFSRMRERLQRHPKDGDPSKTGEAPERTAPDRKRTGELLTANGAAPHDVAPRPSVETAPVLNGSASNGSAANGERPAKEQTKPAEPPLEPPTKH